MFRAVSGRGKQRISRGQIESGSKVKNVFVENQLMSTGRLLFVLISRF